METIEILRAERDALQQKNAALLDQARQLICDLASAKSNGAPETITSRPRGDNRPNAAQPPMIRKTYDSLSPWAQADWVRGGGRVI